MRAEMTRSRRSQGLTGWTLSRCLLLCLLLCLCSTSGAWANRLQGFNFSDDDGVVTVSLELEESVVPSAYDVRFQPRQGTRGALLLLTVRGVTVRRQWVRSFAQMDGDTLLKGILLRPTQENRDGTLRVRFREDFPEGLRESLQIRLEARKLILSFPRDPGVQTTLTPPPPPPAPAPPPLPLFPQADPEAGSASEDSIAAANDPMRASTRPLESPPLDPPVETMSPRMEPLLPAEPAPAVATSIVGAGRRELRDEQQPAAAESAPLEERVRSSQAPAVLEGESADPEPVDFNLWMLAVVFFFALALYFLVLYLRSRGKSFRSRPGEVHIEILGSRLLSPQQRLLVVEVLDQVVLIGAHERGMTMLTRLNEPAAPERAAVVPHHHSMPLHESAPLSAPQPAPRATSPARRDHKEPLLSELSGAAELEPVIASGHAAPAPVHAADYLEPTLGGEALGGGSYDHEEHALDALSALDEPTYSSSGGGSEQEEEGPKEEVSADDLLEKIRQLQRG